LGSAGAARRLRNFARTATAPSDDDNYHIFVDHDDDHADDDHHYDYDYDHGVVGLALSWRLWACGQNTRGVQQSLLGGILWYRQG
jgi:ABC-type Zn2+ transport system substrate-binding protein/surface adhesin